MSSENESATKTPRQAQLIAHTRRDYAIIAEPRRWRDVIIRPSEQKFAAQLPFASWKRLRWYLVILGIINAALEAILSLGAKPIVIASWQFGPPTNVAIYAVIGFISTTAGFLIFSGAFFVSARAFGGHGTFLDQAYLTMLYLFPWNFLGWAVMYIPYVGDLIYVAAFIYTLYLSMLAIAAAHGLPRNESWGAVVVPWLAIIVALLVWVLRFH